MDPAIAWIDSQQTAMERLLIDWASINTGTFHLAGVQRLVDEVAGQFEPIAESILRLPLASHHETNARGEAIEMPLGDALVITRRSDAPLQAVLAIHLDTVYPVDSPFQAVICSDERIEGPGVADAKGGLVVLLYALLAFEHYVAATGDQRLGWRVILNSDEEIGSPCSADVFAKYAVGADFGLVYEPSLPSGNLVGERGGSGNFAIVARGKSAHAGREFAAGRNAVIAAAEVARELHSLNGRWPGVTINVARIDGGSPYNVVPDVAIVRFNVRYPKPELEAEISTAIDQIVAGAAEGITLTREGRFSAPPKLFDPQYQTLLRQVRDCGLHLGLDLAWERSGGVCDGNRLAALGVPNVDTLGVRGGNIHSTEEFMWRASLAERAKLSASFLITKSLAGK
ncbi:hydrolase [Blastopirellula sp. JC732]|uniref:Hydrolase n=1 Tax=Blastopirellula sediminis TaxID=2894196 RepID=A0A9X1MJU7_9BACT|nr:hydrolase [Blastopirellula sediminis]MCC9609167.1 hydrolase [Blastopirellula sediminis]MCC9628056.1 hydrolase [Blastopirellula sediminis]